MWGGEGEGEASSIVSQSILLKLAYLSRVPKAGAHDDSFVVEFLVVIVYFGDADYSGVFLGGVTLRIRVGHVPIQYP